MNELLIRLLLRGLCASCSDPSRCSCWRCAVWWQSSGTGWLCLRGSQLGFGGVVAHTYTEILCPPHSPSIPLIFHRHRGNTPHLLVPWGHPASIRLLGVFLSHRDAPCPAVL